MNVDFRLPATGAIARRLLLIAATSTKIDMDEQVEQIAKQDLLPDDEFFPLTGVRRAATQFILDCGLRCALLPITVRTLSRFDIGIDQSLILNAVFLAGQTKLTIATQKKHLWEDALRGFKTFTDIQLIKNDQAFLSVHQENWRDGVLIYDWDENTLLANAVAKEFPRTIIYSSLNYPEMLDYSMQSIGLCLFPDMNIKHNNYRTYRQTAAMFNIFLPEFATMSGYNK